ncbi:hypothetical protein [Candidatus Electronema sp. PJ]|uniref:hypothetical protein n=1 Tax=Candidatus Electronema sp. PJ TaxID=3401572 RepID=UPI003AA9AB8A
MASIQWKVEQNKLTTPASYRARTVAHTTLDYEGVSSAMAARNPQLSAGLIEFVLREFREEVLIQLANGNAINLENFLKFAVNFATRLPTAVAPLPPLSECLEVQVSASKTLRDDVRSAASAEKIAATEKAPMIIAVTDVTTGLENVMQSGTSIVLNGTNMYFDNTMPGAECVIEGTRNGRTVQTNFGKRANSEIIVVADYPAQTSTHNNEYLISVTTSYTENGSLRTGTYNKRLRVPLQVSIGALATGILSGAEDNPLVNITGGAATASQRIRIQAVINNQDQILRISLLDMTEGGKVGDAVIINGDGGYEILGYTGSTVTYLTITVNDYAALYALVNTAYSNRMIDILNVYA